MVFDGFSPFMKLPIENLRRERRRKMLDEANAELQMPSPNLTKVNSCYKQSVSISHKDIVQSMKKLREIGVDCFVSPMESDSQLTYLQKIGIADYIISEDSDLLVYGNPSYTKVIFKLDFNTYLGELIVLSNVFSAPGSNFKDFIFAMFQKMCILAGSDYLNSIKRIGIKKAFNVTKDCVVLPEIIKSLRENGYDVDDNYISNFERCLNIFLYQDVYDPLLCKKVPLQPLPACVDADVNGNFNLEISNYYLLNLVIDNMVPRSGEKFDNFD